MIYVLIILAIFMIMPIQVVITKTDNRSDIDIFLTKLFNLRIDFDEFIRSLVTTKDEPDRVTVKSVLHNYNLFKESSGTFARIASWTKVKKLTIILKTKSNSLATDTWGFVGSWMLFGYARNYAHRYFRSVENEYYNHQIAPRFNYNIETQLHMRFVIFLVLLYKIGKISRS